MKVSLRSAFVIVVAAGIVVFLASYVPLVAWSGLTTLDISLKVVDINSHKAIKNASVALIESWDPEMRQSRVEGNTDLDGRVILRSRFSSHGVDTLIRTRTSVSYYGWWVKVEAPGYQRYLARLDKGEELSVKLSGKDRYTVPTPTNPPLSLSFPPPPTTILGLRPARVERKGSGANGTADCGH